MQRDCQEHEAVVRVHRENIRSGRKEDKRFKGEDETEVLH